MPSFSYTNSKLPVDKNYFQVDTAEYPGLGTGLYPKHSKTPAPLGSHAVEAFLALKKEDLFAQLDKYNKDSNEHSLFVKRVLKRLGEHPDLVVVPTDKTNSFLLTTTSEYDAEMMGHLNTKCIEISVATLDQAVIQSEAFFAKIKHRLSKAEVGFLLEGLASKATPTPKLLCKNHKPRNPTTGRFDTRWIAPAQNMMAPFSKMGRHLIIKNTFEEAEVPITTHRIEQAHHLKRHLDSLMLTPDNCTIISLDAVNYYPSLHFSLVKKAISWLALDLDTEARNRSAIGLMMIEHGMANTYLTCKDKYYLCAGKNSSTEKAITIGAMNLPGSVMWWEPTYSEQSTSLFKASNTMVSTEMMAWRS